MGVKRFYLIVCAAVSTCVESFFELSSNTKTVDSYRPARPDPFVPDNKNVRVSHLRPASPDKDERGLMEFAGEKMRDLLYKMMGSQRPGAKFIASLMARLHFQHWARKKYSPHDVAEVLKFRNDENLVKLDVLERYVAYLGKKKKNAGITFLDAVVKSFGGEVEFAPTLFKYATQYPDNAQIDALLTALLAKWQHAGKPFKDVFAQFKFRKAGVAVFLDESIIKLEAYRSQYMLKTGVTDVETLFTLLKQEFHSEANLAFRAVDAMGYDATQKQGILVMLDLFQDWEARLMLPSYLKNEVFAGTDETEADTVQAIVREYRRFMSKKEKVE
uniref:RxLR effector candidate protein n=1 Tax=Peronospora matthiolae TaxID=2874970 RepID=A0AAV1T347_9STRA